MLKSVAFFFFLLYSFTFADSISNFYAYYTKIETGQPWETYSRTGPYADLVVQLKHGKLIFHRSSSYLPYWKTNSGKWYLEEIIHRHGDGPPERPDKNNIYSYVRLIKNTADSIVVHWRYFPDFQLGNHAQPIGGNVGFDGVVHEYFTIFPDGKARRVIRKGTKKLDDWNDPKNRTIQILQLKSDGIEELRRIDPVLSKKPLPPVKGAPIRTVNLGFKPDACWHFDEGLNTRTYELKDFTLESESGKACPVGGPKTVWKKGVSGTALAFDGYHSKVTFPDWRLKKFDGGFTIEAWVAPGAYSICEWTAIAHQSKWEADVRENLFQERNWGKMQLGEKIKKGFFLGIDEFGHPGFFVVVDQQIVKVQSFKSLPLYKWSHVAATFVAEGMAYLYINGELVNFTNFSGTFQPADCDFMIGKNDESIGYVSKHVVRTYSTFPSPLGFDGLIDEVKFYKKPLSHDNIRMEYLATRPENQNADMQPRIFPGEVGKSETFGAYYTKLKYHDLWDNMWREPEHPDIVVKFDLIPTSVVFWRGTRSPGWVTENNKWVSDQSTELTDWHWHNIKEGCQSCCEHMSDYQCRHSHVRIIENSEARVIVHWRYASVDVLYKHPNVCRNKDDWGVWTDEYITIYPDGVGVRTVDNHGALDYYYDPNGNKIGFHDTQFLSEAGTLPEDNIHLKALTIISHNDKIHHLDWSQQHPSGVYDAQIIWINLKSNYKVFEVFPPKTKINVWAGEEKTSYSKFSAWNHYPVTQAPCDGRFCVAADRVTHSALGAADNLVDTGSMLIYGFTKKPPESLIPLARSWNYPPALIKLKGGTSKGYEKGQRAYILKAKDDVISFVLNASQKSPVVNPCFVIKGWNSRADVLINGRSFKSNKKVRQGLERDTKGNLQLVIWMELTSEKPIHVKLKSPKGTLIKN